MTIPPYIEKPRSILLQIRESHLEDVQQHFTRQINEPTTPGRRFNVRRHIGGGETVFSDGWLDWINQDYSEILCQITSKHMHNKPLIFLTESEAHYFTDLADPEIKPVISEITRTYEILAPIFTKLLGRLLSDNPYYIHPELIHSYKVGADIHYFNDRTLYQAEDYLKSQDFYKNVVYRQYARNRGALQSILSSAQEQITIVDGSIPAHIKRELRKKLG